MHYAGRNMLHTYPWYIQVIMIFVNTLVFIQEVYLVYNIYRDYIFMKDVIEKQFEIKLGNNGKSRIRSSSSSILYIDF